MLDEPLRKLLGGKAPELLKEELGLETVGDLLRHYPRRYLDRGQLTDLDALQPGENVTVIADVISASARPMQQRKGRLFEVTVGDGHGTLRLTFFNQPWREKDLVSGQRALFAGRVSVYNHQRQLTHPDYQLLPDAVLEEHEESAIEGFTAEPIPVYPATAKITSWKIAATVQILLDVLPDDLDPVPGEVLERQGLIGLSQALRLIHQPASRSDIAAAKARLRFEEAFVLQVVLAQRRKQQGQREATPRRGSAGGLVDAFDAGLAFEPTLGQREIGGVIADDLRAPHPMHRLLQGEVGSGKTLIAVRAMLTVVDSGGQAVLLAPTEVLAGQHDRSVRAMLGPLAERGLLGGDDRGTAVVLLTGSLTAAARQRVLDQIANGDAGIVIGTHALLYDRVHFHDLGLVVVDEQHRFGVEQRDALRTKAEKTPHTLVMTATPIPRTVALTVFGDLDVSTLRELPPGRSPITTHVVPVDEKPHFVDRAWQRVREEVAAGHQVYVVCPRIGDGGDDLADLADLGGPDSDAAGATVMATRDDLGEGPLSGLRLAVLHGRMSSESKDEIMQQFASGSVDVLVSTTVIEVGVDVQNATVMVVVDADRFGVSQLHQLRGRVGRGGAAGLCLLFTRSEPGSPGRRRIDAVAATSDGFALAQLDLETRREGDVLGTSQSGGRSGLRLLRVAHHEKIIVTAREEAVAYVEQDPGLGGHARLAAAVAAAVEREGADFLEKA